MKSVDICVISWVLISLLEMYIKDGRRKWPSQYCSDLKDENSLVVSSLSDHVLLLRKQMAVFPKYLNLYLQRMSRFRKVRIEQHHSKSWISCILSVSDFASSFLTTIIILFPFAGPDLWPVWKLWWQRHQWLYYKESICCRECPRVWKQLESIFYMSWC